MTAIQAHILPGLAQHSLLSVVQMCDSGCSVTFTVDKITVKHGHPGWKTKRDPDSRLCRVPLLYPVPDPELPPHIWQTISMKRNPLNTL
jgi:hypothetical protein